MRKQLQKLIELLSTEQQAEYWRIFNDREKSINSDTRLRRTSVKFSNNMTQEEAKQAIAETYNIPIDIVPDFDFVQKVKKIDEQKSRVKQVIQEYEEYLLHNSSTSNKVDELFDVGHLIFAANAGLKIIVSKQPLLYPNFQIDDGNIIIGLEHTRLIDESIIIVAKNAKQLLKQAEELLQTDLSSVGKTINVFF